MTKIPSALRVTYVVYLEAELANIFDQEYLLPRPKISLPVSNVIYFSSGGSAFI